MRVATIVSVCALSACTPGTPLDTGGRSTTDDTADTAGDSGVRVEVDRSTRFQTWSHWSSLTRRWDSPHLWLGAEEGDPRDPVPASDKEAILDALYADMALDGVEIALEAAYMDPSYRGHDAWFQPERTNDDEDPYHTRADAFDFTYWGPLLDQVDGIARRIRSRGGDPHLSLRVGVPAEWMRGDDGLPRADMAEEYAEWATALLVWMRDERGLTMAEVSVWNEPDGAGRCPPSTLVAYADALRRRLDGAGYQTRLAAPETVTPRAAIDGGYLAHLESLGLADELWSLRYHAYDHDASTGRLPDLDARRALAEFATKHGLITEFSEQSTDVKENRRTFWLDSDGQALAWADDLVTEMTVTNLSGYLQHWAFWTESNPLFGTDGMVTLETDGAGDYTGWRVSRFTETLAVFVDNVRPGMVRVQAASDDPDLRVVAWDDGDGIVVIAVNDGTSDVDVSVPGAARATVPGRSVRAIRGVP